MRNLFMLAIVFLLLISGHFLVYAASQTDTPKTIGTVVAVRGEAIAVDDSNKTRPLGMKDEIFSQDTIKTGINGRIQIIFIDKTIVSLGPKSEVKIAEYWWDPAKQDGAMKSKIKEGVFRYMGGAITKVAPDKFITETPTATIGIRGSMFAGKVGADLLAVMFQGGRGIYVRNNFGSVDIAAPGFGTRVIGNNAAPLTPYRFTGQELKDLTVEPGITLSAKRTETTTESSTSEEQTTEAGGEPTNQDPPPIESKFEPPVTNPEQIKEDPPPLPAPAPPLPTLILNMTGKYQAAQTDLNAATNAGDAIWDGDNNAALYSDNTVAGTPGTATGNFSYRLENEPFDPAAGYKFPLTSKNPNLGRTLNLVGVDQVFPNTFTETLSTNMGDFNLFKSQFIFNVAGQNYDFLEFGFSGRPSVTVPTDGIDFYKGLGLMTWVETLGSGNVNPMLDRFSLGVNWHNGKVLGGLGPSAFPAAGPTIFFYGDVSGTGIANLKIIGNMTGPAGPGITFAENVGAFGQFYGGTNNGIGMTSLLQFFDNSGVAPVKLGDGQATVGAFRGDVPAQAISPTGSVTWNGFVAGLSEDVTNPNGPPRKLFMNNLSTDITLAINRDSGTLSGSINATDLGNPLNQISNLEIGGSRDSVYVADNALFGILGCSTPDCIQISPALGGIKSMGNYLISAEPGNDIASYASWGYWEFSYEDPAYFTQNRLNHNSLWIAGELTPAVYIDGLISANFVGNYIGGAQGARINPSDNSLSSLTNGQTNLTLDFSNSAPVPVTGTISFTEVTLNVNETANLISNSGFIANIVNPSTTGKINGAFFGPNADSIAGTFEASVLSGERYYGIFGGDKQ